MATTYPKQPLVAIGEGDAWLNYVAEDHPELASQQFEKGAVLVADATGFIKEATSPLNASNEQAFGIALEAGHNSASDGDDDVKLVRLDKHFGLVLEGNLMEGGTGGSNHTLAATDRYAQVGLVKVSNFYNGSMDAWCFDTAQAQKTAIVKNFKSTYVPPNTVETDAQVGDINARVRCRLMESAIDWGA